MQSPKEQLRIIYHNVIHLQEICHYYEGMGADLLVFCETRLDATDSIKISNYRIYRSDHEGGPHEGGVLIAANPKFRTVQLPIPYFTDLEIVCVRIEFAFKNIFILCVYISPQQATNACNKLISAIAYILKHVKKDDLVVLLGNINLSSTIDNNNNKRVILGSLQEIGLHKYSQFEKSSYNDHNMLFCSHLSLLEITNVEEDMCMYALENTDHIPWRIQVNIDGYDLDRNSSLNVTKQRELIKLIKLKPVLYDNCNNDYYNDDLRQHAWEEVASKLNFRVEECRQRWKYLRDTFRKRKILAEQNNKEQKWKFFEDMCFLAPYLRPKERGKSVFSFSTITLPQNVMINSQRANASVNTNRLVLRNIENRNQNDKQTQTLPEDDSNLQCFVCRFPDCGKQYMRSSDLSRHQRTHSEEKTFSCQLCEKKFRRKDVLTRHVKTHEILSFQEGPTHAKQQKL